MTSSAPLERASRASLLPLWVSELTIMTGSGKYFISFFRNVRPSIRGISMSKVITSGFSLTILSRATYGSGAVPTTSIPRSRDRPSVKTFRTIAESSTMSTPIFFFMNPHASSERRKANRSSSVRMGRKISLSIPELSSSKSLNRTGIGTSKSKIC